MAVQETRDTKERILDAAERLFSEQGFEAASLRGITADAGVNLAAVHYHFGSKEALIEAVFARRVEPLNRERLERLEALERGDEPPSVDRILEAFLRPALRFFQEHRGDSVLRLLVQTLYQPDEKVRTLFFQQFREVFERFSGALQRALPDLPTRELVWRYLFTLGAMAHTMAISSDVERMTDGLIATVDAEAMVRRLVSFARAGFEAPVPVVEEGA